MALLTGPMLALVSWIIYFVTRSAVEGGLGPNAVMGIRLPATMRSERAWEAGHRAALGPSRLVCWLGVACAVPLTASAFLASGEAPHWVSLVLFAVGYGVIVLGGTIWCSVVAVRAARAADPGEPDPRESNPRESDPRGPKLSE